ncbi:hypothetical protein WP2W18E01_P11100 (plasmid) [Aeromonas caviae]|uniref:Transmembrane protein n=1 Tax=Aeromonas caviae TaxID=648 RepID=A0A6S4U0Q5_AERCA|nr:hypothetical protein WP2W18E01_P11100 [Aeromonas caviae]
MGRFDEGMGRVDPEVGEHIERSKPYQDPQRVKLVRFIWLAVVLTVAIVWFKFIR